MMKIDVSTELNCSAAKAWDEVQKSSLLLHVIWPLARITTTGLPDFPDRWRQGLSVQCRSYVFGFIPIGIRDLHFETIDQTDCRIVTRESDPLAKRWNHTFSVTQLGTDQSIYRDVIDIDASGPAGSTGIANGAGGHSPTPCERRRALLLATLQTSPPG
jgi:hypothetical protein